jgi:hypothetical protein
MWGLAALGLASVAVALTAHEATHALVACAIPGVTIERVRVWPRVVVTAVVPEEYPRVVDAAVCLAPTIVGLAAGAGWLAAVGWPPSTPYALVGVGAWALYTVPSCDDLAAGVADPGEDWSDIVELVHASGVLLCAWVLVAMGGPLVYVGHGVALAGTTLVVRAMLDDDQQGTRAGA